MNETRIGELRKARGWTQERLADESGVAVRTIQRFESGQDASLDTISLVANALEVSVKDLFVSVDKEGFAVSVDQLDARQSAEQQRRDATTQGFHMLYRGVGILVVLAVLVLGLTGTLSWIIGWIIAVAYLAVGRYLFRSLFRVAIDPWLDARYPFSVPARRSPWARFRGRLAEADSGQGRV